MFKIFAGIVFLILLTGCSEKVENTDFMPGEIVCLGDEKVLVLRRAKYSYWVDVRVDGIHKYFVTSEKHLKYC